MDFCPTAFGTIIVSSQMADVVEGMANAEIQRIPACVKGHDGSWEVLNVLSCVDCIDHEKSRIQYYPADHPEKPNKPRGVLKLVLDTERAEGYHIFKPEDWRVVTVVSEELKTALEGAEIEGIEYWRVSEKVSV